jgi:hypothetical protein
MVLVWVGSMLGSVGDVLCTRLQREGTVRKPVEGGRAAWWRPQSGTAKEY